MLKYIVFFFGIYSFSLSAQEREELMYDYQFVYKLTYQPDSSDESSIKDIDMELLTNKEGSLFQSIDKGRKDSMFLVEKKVRMATLMVHPVNKFLYQIVKRGDQIKTYDSAFGMNLQGVDQIYYYEEPKDMFEWQIKEDT